MEQIDELSGDYVTVRCRCPKSFKMVSHLLYKLNGNTYYVRQL